LTLVVSAGGSRPFLVCLPVIDERVFHLKRHWAEAQLCFVREAKQLFSVVLCVVTDAHRFEVTLAISETPEKCRPVGKVHEVILKFLKGSTCFPLTVVGGVKGIYPRCAGQLHSFESGTLLPPSSRRESGSDRC